MSKERLKEMGRAVDDLLNNRDELTSFVNDYYLQSERVQELEQQNKCYHEALMEIEDEGSWCMYADKYARRARQALKEAKNIARLRI